MTKHRCLDECVRVCLCKRKWRTRGEEHDPQAWHVQGMCGVGKLKARETGTARAKQLMFRWELGWTTLLSRWGARKCFAGTQHTDVRGREMVEPTKNVAHDAHQPG